MPFKFQMPLLLGLLLGSVLAAATPVCLDWRQVLEVNKDFDFSIALDNEGLPGTSELDRCNPDQLVYKVYEAILFLKNLPPLTVSFDKYDRGALRGTPFEYFRERIRSIRFEPESKLECNNGETAAYVKPNEHKTMHFCAGSSRGHLMLIASTLMHEARHVDGYPHDAVCNHGRLAGNPGCDKSYTDQGAYAIEIEFNIRIARTPGLPQELRHQARHLAVMTLLENINETPFNIRPGYFLQDLAGQVTFFDRTKIEPLMTLSHPDDLVVLRAQIPTVFNYKSGNVSSYLNSKTFVDTDGIYAAEFREISTEDGRRQILDILYHKRSSCILYTEKLICYRGTLSSEISLQSIKPANLTILADRIVLVDRQGYAYPISHEVIGQPEFTESRLLPTPSPLVVTRLAAESFSVHIGIDEIGLIRRYTALLDPKIPGVVIPALAQNRYKRILGPVWWSAEVAGF